MCANKLSLQFAIPQFLTMYGHALLHTPLNYLVMRSLDLRKMNDHKLILDEKINKLKAELSSFCMKAACWKQVLCRNIPMDHNRHKLAKPI